ncbi:hypothetical protein [Armatimonas sp.]|uniref:hypothetical protein n=1 Tax=Armatimonas sp. TaxID=1872638 RepID=UPI0037509E41
MDNLSFDFDAPEPAPPPPTKPLIEFSAHLVEGKSPAEIAHFAALALAVADFACPASNRGYSINPGMLAFIAQARHHGQTDASLKPIGTDAGGRNLFDEVEVARFANELLCGVRSDRPSMTPERWALAITKAREIGGKS